MDNNKHTKETFLHMPKVLFIGLSVLILYSIIAASIYFVLQREIGFYVRKSTNLALYTTKLSTDLNKLILQSSLIIKYSKQNDKKRLKITLNKAKFLVVSADADFKNLKNYIKNSQTGLNTILPYVNKSYFNYINLIRPIMMRLIKYHKTISKKIFLMPLELALYKESPVFAPLAAKAVEKTIRREKIIRFYVDLIYLIGSFLIFIMILFFIIYSNKKSREIKKLYTRFNLIFDNIQDLAYVTEFTFDAMPRHFIEVNARALKTLNYSRDEFLKLSHLNIINADKKDILNMMKLLFKSGSMTYPAEVKTKDGKIIPLEVTSRVYKIKDEPPMGVCIARDISERVKYEKLLKESEERFKRLSVTDSLTGAYNRNKYKEIIEKEIKRAKRYGEPLSAIMLDLDFFKEINDTHGHITGDDILKEIVSLLTANIRSEDYLIRWGGEEFLIIAPNTSLENAVLLAEKLRARSEGAYFAKGSKITLSLGITEFLEEDSETSFVERADNALYNAKNNGRNRCEVL
ncbi:MAG: sensor domain-containing diguanylate cyclase [bacterium]